MSALELAKEYIAKGNPHHDRLGRFSSGGGGGGGNKGQASGPGHFTQTPEGRKYGMSASQQREHLGLSPHGKKAYAGARDKGRSHAAGMKAAAGREAARRAAAKKGPTAAGKKRMAEAMKRGAKTPVQRPAKTGHTARPRTKPAAKKVAQGRGGIHLGGSYKAKSARKVGAPIGGGRQPVAAKKAVQAQRKAAEKARKSAARKGRLKAVKEGRLDAGAVTRSGRRNRNFVAFD